MRDLALVGFLISLLLLGLRRPFLMVLAYAYIDIVSPQRLSYYLINSVPISAIVFAMAIASWLMFDNKKGLKIAPRQICMLLLLAWMAYTTSQADFPVEAAAKWDWVWKAMVFAVFLPLVVNNKLRIEALALYLVLCASSIIITGGLKTVLSGGGYGSLNLMVNNNSGLYESSTIATVAIMIIPLILYLMKYGTIFKPDWRVKLFGAGLIFACLLMPVGTQARTGLLCIALLGILQLRTARRPFLYVTITAILLAIAVPFLPQSYTQRMDTIQNYKSDSSAGTRLAVWKWTWDYVSNNPAGGGFDAFLQNHIKVETVQNVNEGGVVSVQSNEEYDAARAYHSAYFEMLGEQGFLGLFLWLTIMVGGVIRMEMIYRRFKKAEPEHCWISPMAMALQNCQLIYLLGAVFVGIAFQPFVWMLVALQIGLDCYIKRCFPSGRPAFRAQGATAKGFAR